MNGLIIVDKPVGCTSFDMVAKMRKEYNEKKVGHIGTLDPMASGVLPILLGEATKLSDFLMLHDKEYIATLKLGTKMDTGDSEGKAIEESEIPDLKSLNLHEILNNFLGKQMQIPPMYSAIKVNGRKLYELAREGKSIEIPAREIEIFDIEILNVNYEFKEIEFNTTPNLVYTIYCNSTIEAKSIAATKETPIYKIINETEKEILYDEESGDIIL